MFTTASLPGTDVPPTQDSQVPNIGLTGRQIHCYSAAMAALLTVAAEPEPATATREIHGAA
jgi:hypothetical protein